MAACSSLSQAYCIIVKLFLSVLRKGVEDTIETAVNRTTDIASQALADSGSDLSIPLFTAGLIVGLGFGLNNGRARKVGE